MTYPWYRHAIRGYKIARTKIANCTWNASASFSSLLISAPILELIS
jgi:hypothetical protein